MIVQRKELIPKYSSQKSFYKKAWVEYDDEGNIYLISYSTNVAIIKDEALTDGKTREALIKGWYSMTTSKHINEFLLQHGFNAISKKELEGGVTICKLI